MTKKRFKCQDKDCGKIQEEHELLKIKSPFSNKYIFKCHKCRGAVIEVKT